MSRYLTEDEAAIDGFHVAHEPERSQFTLYHSAAQPDSRKAVGEAHYALRGEPGNESINFDHTFVDPSLRGTGLSGVLARRAVTDDIVTGRTIQASCWFIADYLEKHPELRSK